MDAQLISVSPSSKETSRDSYSISLGPEDFVISKALLDGRISTGKDALIIRILPNNEDKRSRKWDKENPAFFSIEAMKYIRQRSIEHLLVDIPSVDKINDEGHLVCHRIFFGLEPGAMKASLQSLNRSITELIYVPNDIEDGFYKLQIQIPPFELDAVPSNPILLKKNG